MKVAARCNDCKSEVYYKTRALTRVEFAMHEGENVEVVCMNCGERNNFHVDDLRAVKTKLPLVLAGVIMFLLTIFTAIIIIPLLAKLTDAHLVISIGGLLLVPGIAFAIFKRQEEQKISDFNRRNLKGRRHEVY